MERLRRCWPVAVLAVAAVFLLGFYLPRLSITAFSAFLNGLGSGGLDVEVPTGLSLAVGGVFASAAAIGLLRASTSEQAWRKGASGERRVGRVLDGLQRSGVRTLHDRKLPGSTANVDHVVVAPRGVFTIETKSYTGRLAVRGRGSEVWVKGRNHSSVLDQAHRQARVVEALLAGAGIDVATQPVVCFVGTSVPLFSPKGVGGVVICTPNNLAKTIRQFPRPALPAEELTAILEVLEARLP